MTGLAGDAGGAHVLTPVLVDVPDHFQHAPRHALSVFGIARHDVFMAIIAGSVPEAPPIPHSTCITRVNCPMFKSLRTCTFWKMRVAGGPSASAGGIGSGIWFFAYLTASSRGLITCSEPIPRISALHGVHRRALPTAAEQRATRDQRGRCRGLAGHTALE